MAEQRSRDEVLRLLIIEALLPRGKVKDARQLLAGVQRRGPLAPIMHRYYGDLFAAEGAVQEAERSYRTAIMAMTEGDKALEEVDREREKGKEDDQEALELYRKVFESRAAQARERLEETDWDELFERYAPQTRSGMMASLRQRADAATTR
jgi:predicted Zn-dependent protease